MRSIRPKKIPFTKEGFQKVKLDFLSLTEKRKSVVISLQTAREMGDLSENGAYKAARFELSATDRKLRRLKYLLRFGIVTDIKNNGSVDFGRLVSVDDGTKRLTFTLVGSFESDPAKQKLSIASPLGKALLGKKVGDRVVVTAPIGQTVYTVTEIK